MKRSSEYLDKLNEMKLVLVSNECMTKDFLSLFKEKTPEYAQLPARDLATKVVEIYDDLVSKDSYAVRKEANDEYIKMEMKEVETIQEYHARFSNCLWNRNSKFTSDKAILEEEAARRYIDGLTRARIIANE